VRSREPEPGDDDDGDDADDGVERQADAYSSNLLEGTFSARAGFYAAGLTLSRSPSAFATLKTVSS